MTESSAARCVRVAGLSGGHPRAKPAVPPAARGGGRAAGEARGGRAGLSLAEVERADADLARAAREGSTLRLYLGTLLDAVARTGIHHEMGFSSLEAYALEVCQRSSRWVQESRQVARAFEALPELRAALATGELSWSTACLAAARATPDDEPAWLVATQTLTARELRALVVARTPETALVCHGASLDGLEPEAGAARDGRSRAPGAGSVAAEPGNLLESETRTRVLEIPADPEDAWLFECARMIAQRLGAQSTDQVFEALLAETGTMLPVAAMDEVSRDPEPDANEAAQEAWERQLEAWRDEAEARCEPRFASARCSVPEPGVPARSELEGRAPRELHALVREAARRLAEHDLTVGRLAERLWAADGWRRLGYATQRQYVRERLGLRLSCLKNKRALARRAAELPLVAAAVASGAIGSEAARLVAGIANVETCEAWIARARCRTIKHLREDVSAAALVARLEGWEAAVPPSEEEVRELHRIESAVISGAWLRTAPAEEREAPDEDGPAGAPDGQMSAEDGPAGAPDGQMSAGHDGAPEDDPVVSAAQPTRGQMSAGSDPSASDGERATGRQMSAPPSGGITAVYEALLKLMPRRALPRVSRTGPFPRVAHRGSAPGLRGAGRVTLRFRVSAETHQLYRRMQRAFARHGPAGVPFLRFACLSFVDAWKHALPPTVAYGHIYARDRFRCQSPVCSRRDVTPHHLRYRSRGGDDSDENVISLCVWCHLEGIHGGRLRADPPASGVRWRIGREPHLYVVGRCTSGEWSYPGGKPRARPNHGARAGFPGLAQVG
jgi:hypothetical protein